MEEENDIEEKIKRAQARPGTAHLVHRPIVEQTGVSPFDGKTPTYRIIGYRPPVGMVSCGALIDGIYCGDNEAIDNNEGLTPHCDVWRNNNRCPRDPRNVR